MKNNRRAWKVRVYSQADNLIEFLGRKEVVIDYGIEGLSAEMTKQSIEHLIRMQNSDYSEKRISAHTGQVYRILNEVNKDDIFVSPIEKGTIFCIGSVDTDRPNIHDTRITFPIKWLRTEVPLGAFQQDLRYSFMAIMKVCEVKRNNALRRLIAIANGQADPGN